MLLKRTQRQLILKKKKGERDYLMQKISNNERQKRKWMHLELLGKWVGKIVSKGLKADIVLGFSEEVVEWIVVSSSPNNKQVVWK